MRWPCESAIVEKRPPSTRTLLSSSSRTSDCSGSLVDPAVVQPEETVEQIEVGEYRGEVLAVPFTVLVVDQMAVEPDGPPGRWIETREDLHQRRFSAPVATHQKDELVRPQRQVERTEHEALAGIVVIREHDAVDLQLSDGRERHRDGFALRDRRS